MSSYHYYHAPVTTPTQNQQPDIRQELPDEEIPMISRLLNSVLYFIECVFIMKWNNKYRLVALQHRKVLFDKCYLTSRGCRIAFQKLFHYKSWDKEAKADWSHFYDPEKPWWGKKSEIMETGNMKEIQK
jgi:hypothetical protein